MSQISPLNITVLANRDLASTVALNLLLPELIQFGHRVRVFLSARVGKAKPQPGPLEELKFFEQTLFNEILFPALGDSITGHWRSYDGLGGQIGQEFEILNRINSAAGLETLRAAAPDLILSIRYGGILKAKAIAVPRLGVLNLHSGLLPQYRGVMATFWALLNGDRELGTTLHTIDDGTIDTGSILGQTRLDVVPGRSYLWHVLQLYPDGCRQMLDAVARLAAGETLDRRPQPEDGAYYTFPTPSDLSAFTDAGYRLYDHGEIVEIARRFFTPDSSS